MDCTVLVASSARLRRISVRAETLPQRFVVFALWCAHLVIFVGFPFSFPLLRRGGLYFGPRLFRGLLTVLECLLGDTDVLCTPRVIPQAHTFPYTACKSIDLTNNCNVRVSSGLSSFLAGGNAVWRTASVSPLKPEAETVGSASVTSS